jgi:hypothetical protein
MRLNHPDQSVRIDSPGILHVEQQFEIERPRLRQHLLGYGYALAVAGVEAT